MTTLIDAIRSRLEDGKLSPYEVKSLLTTAAADGFQSAEMRQILNAIDRTDHGLTPRIRAQLVVQLGDMGWQGRAALDTVRRRPVNWNERERLTESRHTVEYLLQTAAGHRSALLNMDWYVNRLADPEALAAGRLEPRNDQSGPDDEWREMKSNLREKLSEAAAAMNRFREAFDAIPFVERQLAFASMDGSAIRSWRTLGKPVPEMLTIGASAGQLESISAELPEDGLTAPEGGAESVGGMTFGGAVTWTFESNRFTLPDATVVRAWPVAGDFHVGGNGIRLPSGHVLRQGSVHIQNGEVTLNGGAILEIGGIPIYARRSGAGARGTGDALIAGPNVEFPLPLMNDRGLTAEDRARIDQASQAQPTEPAEPTEPGAPPAEPAPAPADLPQERDLNQRNVRFTVNEAGLPDGTAVRRGSGSMTVLFDGDQAVGVLEDSVKTDPGALLYIIAGTSPVELVDRAGPRGELTSGSAVYRDGNLIGLLSRASGKIDGATMSVSATDPLGVIPYQFDRPNTYVLGAGTTITETPAEGTFEVTGEGVEVRVGDLSLKIIRGGVISENGVITEVLPNSEIEVNGGVIETRNATVTILRERPSDLDPGINQVFFSYAQVAASGKGFSIRGNDSTTPLAGGEDEIFLGRMNHNELRLNGGQIRIETREGELNRPKGLRAFDLSGDVDVISGPVQLNSTRPEEAITARLGTGGPLMWVELGDQVYELDPRAMYETFDPATDPGRLRRLQPIYSERFGGTDRAFAERVVSTDFTVGADTADVPSSFLKNVRTTLAFYLDRELPASGQLDDDAVEALRDFQRFNALEPTGVIDTKTMRMLDEAAPPMNQPTVMRIGDGPLGGNLGYQVAGIIAGTVPVIRNLGRGRSTPKGPLIRAVQQIVGASADGMMGPGTAGAIERWQSSNGVRATGAIDGPTLRKMLATSGTAYSMSIKPRPKVMVMVAMNDEVPDELRRFHELAARRGATAIIIGPKDQDYQDSRELTRFFARAEAGDIDFDWLVISGHSTGYSTWGKLGRFEYSWLSEWKAVFPRAFGQIEKINLLNCYNITPERARSYWPALFENLQVAAGFMYSAPGVESQSSDEFLINSGSIMLELEKGGEIQSWNAQSMARRFERDDFIKWQNAAIFFRVSDDPDGVFGMTATAKREMRMHGAQEELRAIPERFRQAFDNHFRAATEEYAEPPTGHNSILRQYLGAVQHIVDRWQSRMVPYRRFVEARDRFLESHKARYVAEHGSEGGYRTPRREDYPANLRGQAEEYRRAGGWERDYTEVQQLRAKILNLIKTYAIQEQFGRFYGPNIEAFNEFLEVQYDAINADRQAAGEEQLTPVLLPTGQAWKQLNRMQMLQRLAAVRESLQRVDYAARSKTRQEREWAIMTEKDPTASQFASPDSFFARAEEFVRKLEPEFIQAEWLDQGLFEQDLATLARTRENMAIA